MTAPIGGEDVRVEQRPRWKPFQRPSDAPQDGAWFIARSTRPGWRAIRVVHYADKHDRLPIDHTGWLWPSLPTEWMALEDFARFEASLPSPDTVERETIARCAQVAEGMPPGQDILACTRYLFGSAIATAIRAQVLSPDAAANQGEAGDE